MTDINAVIERLEKAELELVAMHTAAKSKSLHPGDVDIAEVRRLGGKVDGIRLALSYLREEVGQ